MTSELVSKAKRSFTTIVKTPVHILHNKNYNLNQDFTIYNILDILDRCGMSVYSHPRTYKLLLIKHACLARTLTYYSSAKFARPRRYPLIAYLCISIAPYLSELFLKLRDIEQVCGLPIGCMTSDKSMEENLIRYFKDELVPLLNYFIDDSEVTFILSSVPDASGFERNISKISAREFALMYNNLDGSNSYLVCPINSDNETEMYFAKSNFCIPSCITYRGLGVQLPLVTSYHDFHWYSQCKTTTPWCSCTFCTKMDASGYSDDWDIPYDGVTFQGSVEIKKLDKKKGKLKRSNAVLDLAEEFDKLELKETIKRERTSSWESDLPVTDKFHVEPLNKPLKQKKKIDPKYKAVITSVQEYEKSLDKTSYKTNKRIRTVSAILADLDARRRDEIRTKERERKNNKIFAHFQMEGLKDVISGKGIKMGSEEKDIARSLVDELKKCRETAVGIVNGKGSEVLDIVQRLGLSVDNANCNVKEGLSFMDGLNDKLSQFAKISGIVVLVGALILGAKQIFTSKGTNWPILLALAIGVIDLIQDSPILFSSSTSDIFKEKAKSLGNTIKYYFDQLKEAILDIKARLFAQEPETIVSQGEDFIFFDPDFKAHSALISLVLATAGTCVTQKPIGKETCIDFMKSLGNWQRLSGGIADVCTYMVNLVRKAINYIRENCMGLGPLTQIIEGEDKLNKWLADFKEFQDTKLRKGIKNDVATADKIITLQFRAIGLKASWPSTDKGNRLRAIVTDKERVLQKILDGMGNINQDGAGMRQEPVCVLVIAPPGYGKTYATTYILTQVLLMISDPDDREKVMSGDWQDFFYNRIASHEYWDAYCGQLITVFDDLGQFLEPPGSKDSECQDIIRGVSGFQYAVHRAEMENKGNCFFRSKIIFCTGNKLFDPDSLRDKVAYRRRIKLFRLHVKDEYLKNPHDEYWNQVIDWDKVDRATQEGKDFNPNIYYYQQLNSLSEGLTTTTVYRNRSAENPGPIDRRCHYKHSDEDCECGVYWKKNHISVEDFVLWLAQQYKIKEYKKSNMKEYMTEVKQRVSEMIDLGLAGLDSIPESKDRRNPAEMRDLMDFTNGKIKFQGDSTRSGKSEVSAVDLRAALHGYDVEMGSFKSARTSTSASLPKLNNTPIEEDSSDDEEELDDDALIKTLKKDEEIGMIKTVNDIDNIIQKRGLNTLSAPYISMEVLNAYLRDLFVTGPSAMILDFKYRKAWIDTLAQWKVFREWLKQEVDLYGTEVDKFLQRAPHFWKKEVSRAFARKVGDLDFSDDLEEAHDILSKTKALVSSFYQRHPIFTMVGTALVGLSTLAMGIGLIVAVMKPSDPVEEQAYDPSVKARHKPAGRLYKVKRPPPNIHQQADITFKHWNGKIFEGYFEFMEDKKYDFMTQSRAICRNTEEIAWKVLSKNTYAFLIDMGDDADGDPFGTAPGDAIMINGDICMIPYHYVSLLKNCMERGVRSVQLTRNDDDDKARMFINPARVLGGKRFGNLDLFFFRTGLREHKKISHHFVSEAYLSGWNSGNVMLVRMESDPLIVKMEFSDGRWVDSLQVYDSDGSLLKMEHMIEYDIPTKSGHCGSPLYLYDKSASAKILGIHVAGGCGRGYTIPVTQEMIRQVHDLFGVEDVPDTPDVVLETAELQADVRKYVIADYNNPKLNEAMQITPKDDCPFPGESFKMIGTTKIPAPFASKSQIVRSRLYGMIKEPISCPAHLSVYTNSKGEKIEPFSANISRYGSKVAHYDDTNFRIAAEMEFADMHYRRPKFKPRNWTFEEACAGIFEHDYADSLPLSTSAGYPYSLLAKSGGKRDYFGSDGKFDFNRPLAVQLRKTVMWMWEFLAREDGWRLLLLFSDHLKDERLPKEKADRKTRVFNGVSLDGAILVRMCMGAWSEDLVENHVWNGSCIGINVYGYKWDALYHELTSLGPDVLAGDYSGFDSSQTYPMFQAIVDKIINPFYDDGIENFRRRRNLMYIMMQSCHIRGNVVYQWSKCLSSGNPMTAPLNTTVNKCLIRACYLDNHPEGLDVAIKTYLTNVKPKCYGDDSVVNVSPRVKYWFNQETLTQMMKKYGMIYTNEAKDGRIFITRNILEVQFLKRNFRYEKEICKIVAPLELSVILEMPNWTKDCSDKEQIEKDNIRVALEELCYHPQEVYDEWAPKLLSAAKKYLGYIPPLQSRKALLKMMLDRANSDE